MNPGKCPQCGGTDFAEGGLGAFFGRAQLGVSGYACLSCGAVHFEIQPEEYKKAVIQRISWALEMTFGGEAPPRMISMKELVKATGYPARHVEGYLDDALRVRDEVVGCSYYKGDVMLKKVVKEGKVFVRGLPPKGEKYYAGPRKMITWY